MPHMGIQMIVIGERVERLLTRVIGVVVLTVTRLPVRFAVEDQTQNLARSKIEQCLFQQPAGGFVGRHNNEETIDPLSQELAVRGWKHRRAVQQHIVVALTGVANQLTQSARSDNVIAVGDRAPRRDHVEIEWPEPPDCLFQTLGWHLNRIDETRTVVVFTTEHACDGGTAEVSVEEQHSKLPALRDGSRKIDRGHRFPIPGDRGGVGEHATSIRRNCPLHSVTQRPVLIGFEGIGLQQAHQTRIRIRLNVAPPGDLGISLVGLYGSHSCEPASIQTSCVFSFAAWYASDESNAHTAMTKQTETATRSARIAKSP